MAKKEKSDKIKIENKPNNRSNILIIIALTSIFGLTAGMVGSLIIRSYVFQDAYSIPYSGEIYLSRAQLSRANLIIENAKKIIIEQDNKVAETVNSVQTSLVGIFEAKKETAEKETANEKFNLNNYYRLADKISEGIIITSDGWILAENFDAKAEKNYENYVVITKNNEIYNIKEVVKIKNSNYVFILADNAKELPVKNFGNPANLTLSQMVIAASWDEKAYLTSVISKRTKEDEFVLNSDKVRGGFVLADDLSDFFKTAFIFNLGGELIGTFDKKNKEIISINHFEPIIKNISKGKEILGPSLGVNYVNLSDFAINQEKLKKGALIYSDSKITGVIKGGAADKAGLKTGDIILSINGLEINKDRNLADIIQNYSAEDEVNIIYLRNNEERVMKVKLGKEEIN